MSIISGANAVVGSSGAYQISRSLRFNSADSAFLNRTPASAGNRKTWTWSGWVKRGRLGVNTTQTLFGAGNNDGTDGGVLLLYFLDSNVLLLGTYQTKLETTQVFRDPSAWYHIICAVDTTQSGITNQAKLYVNGVQITQFSTSNAFSASVNTPINNTIQHEIGRQANATSRYFDGYLTEINFIDGSALTPSSFGETDTVTGVWTPKKYTGTYGTNGFYLNFSDNSGTTSTTLGKDSSGNGNNWTPNNFSVTAGAGNDSLVDSPTRYGTDTGAGGEVRGNYCTLNPLDVFSVGTRTLQNGNLDINTSSGAGGARSTIQIPSSGKWYFEFGYVSGTWAGNKGVGIGLSTANISGAVIPTNCVTYNVNGNKTSGSAYSAYGASYTTTDVIGVAVDQGAGTVTFYKNNTSQGAITHGLSTSDLWALFVDPSAASSTQWFNFGQRPFAYTAPSGFKALVTTNLPTPTIADGGDYFNTVLYTGNGSTQTISGVGFQPDFVWIKGRSYADAHTLWNAISGAQKSLSSNTTTAETTRTTALTAFASDGFTLGADTIVNFNANTFVAWNWKANGAGVSNTAGTITSTVSANTDSGFSIVTYTGTGSNATIGHGLGVAPRMIIWKQRAGTNSSVNFWIVWQGALSATQYLSLNATDAVGTSSSIMNSTLPTSSVFSVGTSGSVNVSAGTYVAYCFAPVAGYSAFGSYTGNGSSDGVFVYTGFRPRFVLIKSTAVENWTIQDSARSEFNVIDDALFPALSNAESTANANLNIDFLSNGFKVRSAGAAINNTNAQTYIFAAFAENPFAYSLAR